MRGLMLLGPEPGESVASGAGGGSAAGPGSAPEPTLDSTAGLAAADLAGRPTFDDRGSEAGTGGGAGTAAPAPADPNIAAGAGAAPQGQAQAAAGTQPGIREAALAYGLDLSSFADDSAAWAYMVQAAQRGTERNYYAELGQQIAPHYPAIQKYLEEQQRAAAGPKEPARPLWKHPEYDQRWQGLVERDQQTGTYRPKSGINPMWADKVQAYHDSVDQWATGIVQDAEGTLGPLIRQVAGALLDERFGAQAQQQAAQQIYQANESWLYQQDAQGHRQYDAAGRAVPSPMGARYYAHLQTLRSAGVSDARTLDTLAKSLLQADVLAAQQQQGQLQQQRAGNGTAPATHRPNQNTGQALPADRRGQVPGGSEPDLTGLSLSDRLRREFEAAGVSDADFQSLGV